MQHNGVAEAGVKQSGRAWYSSSIAEFAGALRATHPDFAYAPGRPQVLHDAGRLGWGSGPRGAAPAYTGWDFILVRDGRIAALYVFLDEESAETQRMRDASER